jgi:hypothetical protein
MQVQNDSKPPSLQIFGLSSIWLLERARTRLVHSTPPSPRRQRRRQFASKENCQRKARLTPISSSLTRETQRIQGYIYVIFCCTRSTSTRAYVELVEQPEMVPDDGLWPFRAQRVSLRHLSPTAIPTELCCPIAHLQVHLVCKFMPCACKANSSSPCQHREFSPI